METYQILFNPLSGGGCGEAKAHKLDELLEGNELIYRDATLMQGYADLFAFLGKGEKVVVCGGDGTLNRFVNDMAGVKFENEVYLYGTGTGNDFLFDLGKKPEDGLVLINDYIKDLPRVRLDGGEKEHLFINGVGYGIDGYCCEEGDRLRALGKKVNYTSIAIKGLLGKYKPVNARVTVDGETGEYRKVWLAPTMNGRCYGGGMMATPAQDRLNPERTVSTLVYYGIGPLRALIIFPKIFTGEHVKHTKLCRVMSGHRVTVEFDRPTALQIDGETFLNVRKYEVISGKAE
ncbi:MAG: diacylglycerol kinase family protein [Clostridia bacterium]|nr:diacylglycerol kinase family protein [Clostridia bacterium]